MQDNKAKKPSRTIFLLVKNIFSSRKANANDAIDWFVAILITAMAFLLLGIIVSALAGREIDSSELAAESYIAHVYYSPEIFGKEFGSVDKSLFTQEALNKQNIYVDEISARISLLGSDKVVISSIYTKKNLFDQKYPLAKNNVRNGGYLLVREYPVQIVQENEKSVSGYLRFEVIS